MVPYWIFGGNAHLGVAIVGTAVLLWSSFLLVLLPMPEVEGEPSERKIGVDLLYMAGAILVGGLFTVAVYAILFATWLLAPYMLAIKEHYAN